MTAASHWGSCHRRHHHHCRVAWLVLLVLVLVALLDADGVSARKFTFESLKNWGTKPPSPRGGSVSTKQRKRKRRQEQPASKTSGSGSGGWKVPSWASNVNLFSSSKPSTKTGAARTAAAAAAPAAAKSTYYLAVSTLVWGDNGGSPNGRTNPVSTGPGSSLSFQSGCQLLIQLDEDNNDNEQALSCWNGRALWDRHTVALWKSLAFLSDVVVLVLDSRDTALHPNLVQALKSGFTARIRDGAGMPKGNLIVILNTRDPTVDMEQWKQRLALYDLSGITANIVDKLYIVPTRDFGKSLDQVQQQRRRRRRRGGGGGVSRMADIETFPSLLRQVHRAFGGGNKSMLQGQKENLFQVQQEKLIASVDNKKEKVGMSPADSALEAQILETAQEELDELQADQEEALLSDPDGLPLEFGTRVQAILQRVERSVRRTNPTVKALVQQQVGRQARQLYILHLQALRDYYGKLYEATLEKNAIMENPNAWRDAATRVTERFRKACMDAVPPAMATKRGKLFSAALELAQDRSQAETGLVSDMMEAMVQREEQAMTSLLLTKDGSSSVEDFMDMETSGEATGTKRRKWLKKLATRALVFGINYIQGWLAWQGVKHAALEREHNMPKFPLF